MLHKVYAVYDSAAGCYMAPFHTTTEALARRMFGTVVNDGNSQIALNPSDFSLHFLGTFDPVSGKFEQGMDPVSLGLATTFKKEQFNASQPVGHDTSVRANSAGGDTA